MLVIHADAAGVASQQRCAELSTTYQHQPSSAATAVTAHSRPNCDVTHRAVRVVSRSRTGKTSQFRSVTVPMTGTRL